MRTPDKVRENRLRRMAERQGLRLTKSRRRDLRAYDYDRYWLLNARTSRVVCSKFGLDMDQVEQVLTGDTP